MGFNGPEAKHWCEESAERLSTMYNNECYKDQSLCQNCVGALKVSCLDNPVALWCTSDDAGCENPISYYCSNGFTNVFVALVGGDGSMHVKAYYPKGAVIDGAIMYGDEDMAGNLNDMLEKTPLSEK